MLPATKACRAHLKELNDHYRGVVVALRPGDLCEKEIRFEIQGFLRNDPPDRLDYLRVRVVCLTTDDYPQWGRLRRFIKGKTYQFYFDRSRVDDLLRNGTTTVISNVHAEEWYRPDMQCMAV